MNSDEMMRKAALAEAEKYLSPYNLEVRLRHEAGEPADMIVMASQEQPFSSLMVIGGYARQ